MLRSFLNSSSQKAPGVQRLLWLLLTTAALTIIMTPVLQEFFYAANVLQGTVAKRTVTSPVDFVVTEKSEDQSGEVVSKYTQIKRGEVIVRMGEQVSSQQQLELEHLRLLQGSDVPGRVIVGFIILTLLILYSSFLLTRLIAPSFRPTGSDLALLVATLVGSFILVKAYSVLGKALAQQNPDVEAITWMLAAPVAAGGILLNVTLGPASVLLFTMAFGLLSAVFFEGAWVFLLLVVIGNIVGAVCVQNCTRRASFIVAGIRVAVANMLIVLCGLLFYSSGNSADYSVQIIGSILGGFTAGVLAAGLAPIAEYIGAYVTDIKLLELASLDRPLLRDLSVQAPGTWNHSMVIGQMAEAAAEAIGGNGLLARVGAYYHDIGKMKKPAYFVENQLWGDNRHDKLTPSMSALIIRSHVKDGVELARLHRLPKPIAEFIPQHHGTSLIEYFYEKAKKDLEDDETVDQSHYRYPGPKPQTKESGILMLADQIEASSRTLSDPTPAKVQGLVQKIINKVFASGELDESELTLKDLHVIAKSFVRVLNGIYHRRIEYFESAEKGKKLSTEAAENNALQESEHDSGAENTQSGIRRIDKKSSEKKAETAGGETLKRLGI